MALNITTAVIGSGCNAATASPSLAQWDKGQILQISGVELPETYKVEFSNGDTLEAIPAIGTAEGVEIPDKLLYSSSPIRAYIVLSEAEGERNTEYWVTIYVKPREIPEDIEPDPAQQDVIDDLIAQLNTGVGKAEDAADAAEAFAQDAEAASQTVQDLGVRAETAAAGAPAAVQKIVDAETGAVTLVFFLPQGEAGVSPVVTVTTITGGHRVTVTDADGAHSFDVMDGRSVTGVTMGADYKLTFTFSDGTTWTTPTSIRGETGATPRLTIGTVQTLEPGQSASAEITGTPEDPVLNLGIPKGQAGASDAGGVTYDPTETYQSGTAGAALNDLSRQLSDLEDTVSTTQIINTASGAIASFDDGADNMPIRKLVANIEPVQDLHGYANPWPAGGGKNIFRCYDNNTFSRNGLTVEMHGHYITLRGTVTADANVNLTFGAGENVGSPLENNTNYTWSAKSEGTISSGLNVYGGFTGDATYQTGGFNIDGSATVKTAATGNLVDRVWLATHAGEVYNGTLYIQTEKGSVKTAFEPWENICPISGHTGMEVQRTGINQLDESTAHTDNNYRYFNVPLGENNLLYMSLTDKDTSVNVSDCSLGFTDTDINGVSRSYRLVWQNGTLYENHSNTANSGTIGKLCDLVFTYPNTEDAWNRLKQRFYISVNYPSTDHEYHAYTGNQISVDWEDEAGTVYGGTLDLNPDRTGQLVVDRAMIVYDGSSDESWIAMSATQYGISYFYSRAFYESWAGGRIPTEAYANANFICNYGIVHNYSYIDGSASIQGQTGVAIGYGLRIALNGLTPDDITLDEWKSWLAENNVQLTAPLETPLTYALTESEISGILSTLYGTNNIWSSTGDTEVEYPCDTKLYIDNKITQAIANALNS